MPVENQKLFVTGYQPKGSSEMPPAPCGGSSAMGYIPLVAPRMKHVTLALNTLQPETWTRHEVTDLCEFLKSQFGERFPDTARIYHEQVSQDRDVTPSDEAGIAKLQALSGPFYVMVYPGEPTTWIAVISIVLSVASYVLAPSAKSVAPVVAQRNTVAASPNNELSDRSNKARPKARIPDIYGTVRSTPDLIAAPYKIFENGVEVEYAYMCVTRGEIEVTELISGAYDVRDAETLISNIPGSTVEVYAPYTSPNIGEPQLRIGSPITEPLKSVRKSNSINGQVLRPPNAQTFVGDSNVRFVWPNIIEMGVSAADDFTKYFVAGDEITLSSAELTAGGSTSEILNGYIYGNSGAFNVYFAGELSSLIQDGVSITIDDISADSPGFGYEATLDLSGSYTIDAVTDVTDYNTWNENNYGIFTFAISLVNPASINSQWDDINALGQLPIYKRFQISFANPSLGFDLDGTYDIVSVSAKQIVVNDPETVSADWGNLEDSPSPFISPTIASSEGYKYVGPFIMDDDELTGLMANFVAQNGLYHDNGTDQLAISVSCIMEVTPVNSVDEAAGVTQSFWITLPGSSTLKETVAATLHAALLSVGRCSVRVARITQTSTSFEGTVVDEVRWRDLYSSAPVEDENFGNVTTIFSKTFATASALAVKERRLNLEVTRMLPSRVGSTSEFTSELTATTNAADIFCAICLDPYIGRRQIAELDVASIYDTLEDVEDYFGTVKATEFCYTFDSDNMSFEETAQLIAGAVFCTAYRRGNVFKWNFERATDSSTLLFNHRNKLPGSETRTVTFGRNNNNDGIEYSYVNPDDDSLATIYLPENYSAASPKKIESIGVRGPLQAYFHAWRAWNRILYQHTSTEFEATQEADLLVRNDRILVTDGTRPYTRDGEVMAVDGLELTLSQPVNDTYDLITEEGEELTDEDGDTLTTEPGDMVIWLQHTDGIAESIPITMGSDQYHVILDQAPRLPLVTDKEMSARTGYIIVAQDVSHEMAFLVEEKSAAKNMTSTVNAVNYDARYYERDTDYINELIDLDGYGPRGGHVTITDPEQGPGSV